MEKSAIDREFEQHQQAQQECREMIKQAFEKSQGALDSMNTNKDRAVALVKKAHAQDRADISVAYAAEAQVYATLYLADAIRAAGGV